MTEWHDCNDLFPPDWEPVLLWVPTARPPWYAVGHRYRHLSGEYLWNIGGTFGAHGMVPTHWMPLPRPPDPTGGGP